MKRCSTSLIITEIQIKISWDTITHPCKWLKLKRLTMSNVDKDSEQLELSYMLLVGTQNGTPLWKMIWKFLLKLSVCFPHVTTISLLCFYPREMKTYTHTNSSFIHNGLNCRQLKCQSAGERVNKLWCIHPIVFYSAIKRNEWLIHTTWRISSIKLRASHKRLHSECFHLWNSRKFKTTVADQWVLRDGVGGKSWHFEGRGG